MGVGFIECVSFVRISNRLLYPNKANSDTYVCLVSWMHLSMRPSYDCDFPFHVSLHYVGDKQCEKSVT